MNARLSGGNQTVHLSSISAPPIQEQPPDLIVAIGAPAARLDIDDRNDITMRCFGSRCRQSATLLFPLGTSPDRMHFSRNAQPRKHGVWSVPSANSY